MRRSFRAVVFDLDGVLWDGEPLYHEAFNVVLKPYGHSISLTDPEYVQIIGKSVEAAWEWMRKRFELTESPRVVLSRVQRSRDRADEAAAGAAPGRPRAAR